MDDQLLKVQEDVDALKLTVGYLNGQLEGMKRLFPQIQDAFNKLATRQSEVDALIRQVNKRQKRHGGLPIEVEAEANSIAVQVRESGLVIPR